MIGSILCQSHVQLPKMLNLTMVENAYITIINPNLILEQ